jgi:hypothetical protein
LKMHGKLSNVQTLEFASTFHSSFGNVSSNQSFLWAGKRYRVERNDLEASGDAQVIRQKWSCDGSKYYKLDDKYSLLKVSSYGQPGAFSPILAAYSWLFATRCQQKSWSRLQNVDYWRELSTQARLTGKEQLDAYECHVIEHEQACVSGDFFFRIWVGTEQLITVKAIRMKRSTGELASVLNCTGWTEFTSESGESSLSLPTEIRFEQFDVGDSGAAFNDQHHIEVKSVRLNHSVPDERFVLLETNRFEKIRDADGVNQQIKAVAGPIVASTSPNRSGAFRWFLLAVNLSVGAIVLWFIWHRKNSK